MSNSKVTTVLVLGGGYGGLSAAMRIAKKDQTRVVVIDSRKAFFERIRLHESLTRPNSRLWPYKDVLAQRGIEFVQGKVLELDPELCEVIVRQESQTLKLSGDYVVYALGSYPDAQAIPGLESYGNTLFDLQKVENARSLIEKSQNPRIVIGGGGLTAIELAAELAEAYSSAHIALVSGNGLNSNDGPGGLSPQASAYIRSALTRLGVEVRERAHVSSLEPGMARLTSGETIEFEFYFHATGFIVPDLARRSGLSVNKEGRILVDRSLRSVSHARVLAVGDAAFCSTPEGHPTRMSCATALPMGAFAAQTLLALMENREPSAVQIGYVVRNVSLGRNDGLTQFLDEEDRPLNRIWTGKKAAKWKEFICRGTLSSIRLERAPLMRQIPPINLLPRMYRLNNQTK